MSYLTVEVDINHGRIVPREPEKLPETGSGLLTILNTATDAQVKSPRRLPEGGLHPTKRIEPRPIGLAKGEFVVPDDFNAPLPEDMLRNFEG